MVTTVGHILNYLLRQTDGLFYSAQFVIYFLQLAFGFAGCNHTGAGLIDQFILTAHKGADHNSMITLPIETHKPNGATIITSGSWLKSIYEFHGLEFRRP